MVQEEIKTEQVQKAKDGGRVDEYDMEEDVPMRMQPLAAEDPSDDEARR